MIVAELRVIALGKGTSLEEPVQAAVQALKEKGVHYEVGPMGTTVEAESMDDILEALRAVHARTREHAGRIFTQVTIDERLDKEETAESLKKV